MAIANIADDWSAEIFTKTQQHFEVVVTWFRKDGEHNVRRVEVDNLHAAYHKLNEIVAGCGVSGKNYDSESKLQGIKIIEVIKGEKHIFTEELSWVKEEEDGGGDK